MYLKISLKHKNIKQEEVFDQLISLTDTQLPPDNYIAYTDHDKKNNKFIV